MDKILKLVNSAVRSANVLSHRILLIAKLFNGKCIPKFALRTISTQHKQFPTRVLLIDKLQVNSSSDLTLNSSTSVPPSIIEHKCLFSNQYDLPETQQNKYVFRESGEGSGNGHGSGSSSTTRPGRHMYNEECESAVNDQIQAEFNASYAYLGLAAYFGRSDVALPGCYGFFMSMYEEEIGHALKLLKYQNLRGGTVKLKTLDVKDFENIDIGTGLKIGLQMEKEVKEKLIKVHDAAEKHHDLSLMDFIITDYIQEQERSINEFARLLQRYNSMKPSKEKHQCCGCADFLMDREIHKSFVKRGERRESEPASSENSLYK